MNLVEAVTSSEQIAAVNSLLFQKGEIYADIWKVGINTALRISDLLSVRFSDLDLERKELRVRESKTKKNRCIRLNTTVLQIIRKRRRLYSSHIYLFQSNSNRSVSMIKAIDRSTVSRVFKSVGVQLNLRLGTHSLRKTRGYYLYTEGVPIEKISRVLNHSCPSVTMRYIGITE